MGLLGRSTILAASLFCVAGAITFAVVLRRSQEPAATPGMPGSALSALDGRLSEVAPSGGPGGEDTVLERLDRLEAGLAALSRELKRPPPEAAAHSGSTSAPEDPPAAVATAGRGKSPAPAFPAEEAGELRSFIHQVIQEEREERRQEEERRRAEEKRRWEEFGQGPYGDFNFRVNCMSSVLDLDERQTQRYFEILSHYSSRLEESARGLNKLDPESLRAYEERKKAVLGEFEAAVVQALTPSQAQQYRDLPPHARSPGSDSTKALTLLVTRAEARSE